MTINDLFNSELKNIVFIEKKDKDAEGIAYLPIRTSSMITGIMDKSYEEKINYKDIIEGIVYLLGLDSEFKYKNEYNELIKKGKKEALDIITRLVIEAERKKDYKELYILLNGLVNIGISSNEITFKRANALENIYNENFEDINQEIKEEILELIIKEYEKVELDIAKYRLGYIYISLERYLKSKLYFEKFINESNNENLKEEAREVLLEIEDYVNMESAQTFIEYGEFHKAIEKLNSISRQYPLFGEKNYLLGTCYYKIGNYIESIQYLEEAIKDENTLREEYFNQLALTYLETGKEDLAIQEYNKGILRFNDSYTLFYNRGVLLFNKGENKKALEDFKKAYALKANPELLEVIDSIESSI